MSDIDLTKARVNASELDKIRKTDNGLKDCDKDGINQDAKPLELDANGLPVGYKAGE